MVGSSSRPPHAASYGMAWAWAGCSGHKTRAQSECQWWLWWRIGKKNRSGRVRVSPGTGLSRGARGRARTTDSSVRPAGGMLLLVEWDREERLCFPFLFFFLNFANCSHLKINISLLYASFCDDRTSYGTSFILESSSGNEYIFK